MDAACWSVFERFDRLAASAQIGVGDQAERPRIDFSATLDGTSTNAMYIAPQLSTGGVVGAGVALFAASDSLSIRNRGTDEVGTSNFGIYTGLTPGNTVNAFLMFRTSGASANISDLRLVLSQA